MKELLGRPRCRWECILNWLSHKQDINVWAGFDWLRKKAAASNILINLGFP
jgi:hypothetical protein